MGEGRVFVRARELDPRFQTGRDKIPLNASVRRASQRHPARRTRPASPLNHCAPTASSRVISPRALYPPLSLAGFWPPQTTIADRPEGAPAGGRRVSHQSHTCRVCRICCRGVRVEVGEAVDAIFCIEDRYWSSFMANGVSTLAGM